MKTILSLTLIVEPDRQRFTRLAVEAVQALGGNSFHAVSTLSSLLPQLRNDGAEGPLDVKLLLDHQRVSINWHEHWEVLSMLEDSPAPQVVAELCARLKEASEETDVELLMKRNQQFKHDLENAKQRAAAEMAELETILDKKKEELQESIREAETDSLTGLLNRGAYDKRLREAFLRCKRQREPLSLVLLDLDKFKEINDTHGHQYGDGYLARMATAMRSSVREDVDFTCRFGGDEFAIIMYCEPNRAERVAEMILAKMNGKVSIGIAQLQPADTIETFVERTDKALYEAKRRGRGQYVVVNNTTAVHVETEKKTQTRKRTRKP